MMKNVIFLFGTFVLIVTFASFEPGKDQVQGKVTLQIQEESVFAFPKFHKKESNDLSSEALMKRPRGEITDL